MGLNSVSRTKRTKSEPVLPCDTIHRLKESGLVIGFRINHHRKGALSGRFYILGIEKPDNLCYYIPNQDLLSGTIRDEGRPAEEQYRT